MLLAVALMLATGSASAQTIYMKIGPDGHKTFSDRPDPMPGPESAPTVEELRAPIGIIANGSRRAAIIDANEALRRSQREEKLRLAKEQAQRRSKETLLPQIAQR